MYRHACADGAYFAWGGSLAVPMGGPKAIYSVSKEYFCLGGYGSSNGMHGVGLLVSGSSWVSIGLSVVLAGVGGFSAVLGVQECYSIGLERSTIALVCPN